MFRWLAVGAGALLGAFHLWVLGNQAWTGQLTNPDVGLRWLAAAGIGIGLVALRRRGMWRLTTSAALRWRCGCWRRCSTGPR